MKPSGGEAEILYGFHPVLEALQVRRRRVERLLVAREGGGGRLGRLLRLAREAGIPVSRLPRSVLSRRAGTGAAHQGVAALVSPVPYAEADEVCREAAGRPDGLLVVLDGVTDSGNLGAALRTAAAAGVQGVLLGASGTAGLGAAAARASAGALERVPVAREARLRRRLEALRQDGFSVVALDLRGPEPWDAPDLAGRLVVVAGGEERGLRRGVLEACDRRVTIPLAPEVESLNVSVALGVLLFEARRQRRACRAEAPGVGLER